jgi:hypothetical protein
MFNPVKQSTPHEIVLRELHRHSGSRRESDRSGRVKYVKPVDNLDTPHLLYGVHD